MQSAAVEGAGTPEGTVGRNRQIKKKITLHQVIGTVAAANKLKMNVLQCTQGREFTMRNTYTMYLYTII